MGKIYGIHDGHDSDGYEIFWYTYEAEESKPNLNRIYPFHIKINPLQVRLDENRPFTANFSFENISNTDLSDKLQQKIGLFVGEYLTQIYKGAESIPKNFELGYNL